VRIEILPEARDDLLAGFWFYERQARGLGADFRDSLDADIESLGRLGGVHGAVFGYHRKLSRRFPFAIYYRVDEDIVRIRAILDCRKRPSWIRRRLRGA
jgi:plasmid stabilization system protein ParE